MATVFNFTAVDTCKDEFRNQNEALKTAKNALVGAKQKAENVWEGDAKEAFKKDMDAGVLCLEDMITLLEEYQTVLDGIKQNYEDTERHNLQTIQG